jgi:hypothetical protein
MQRLVQYSYDYLLDRYGVLVGNFRGGIIIGGATVSTLYDYGRDLHDGLPALTSLYIGLFQLFFMIAVSWPFLLKAYLIEETELQRENKLNALCRKALAWSKIGPIMRFILLLALGGVGLYSGYASSRPLSWFFVIAPMLLLTYANSVLVRGRDEDRFRVRREAFSLG